MGVRMLPFLQLKIRPKTMSDSSIETDRQALDFPDSRCFPQRWIWINSHFPVEWSLLDLLVLSVQEILSGSGRATRRCIFFLARPEQDNTFWIDSTNLSYLVTGMDLAIGIVMPHLVLWRYFEVWLLAHLNDFTFLVEGINFTDHDMRLVLYPRSCFSSFPFFCEKLNA